MYMIGSQPKWSHVSVNRRMACIIQSGRGIAMMTIINLGGDAGCKYAEIALEIEPWRVVLSDNDAWNSVIGHCPVIYEEDDEKWNAEWERCMKIGKNAIEATWPKIFRSDVPYVQATFWELLKSDIVDVKVFTSKGYEQ